MIIHALERIIVEDDVRLVIIDPLMAYLDETINPNSDASIRDMSSSIEDSR